MKHDVGVIGLGAMGAAAMHALAGRGLNVIGFDRFTPPHTMGSSHGGSRIIREAYWEDPAYVPMVQRAYGLWKDLEHTSGEGLLRTTGGIFMGPTDGELVPSARRVAETNDLPFVDLTPDAVGQRWPMFEPADDMVAFFEPRAGMLFPERCVAALLAGARGHGATLRTDEAVRKWRRDAAGWTIATARRDYHVSHLVLAGGAYLPGLLDIELPLQVERQVQLWYRPTSHADAFRSAPVFAFEPEAGRLFYGLPDAGEGVKVAIHHEGEPLTTDDVAYDRVDRDVRATDVDAVASLLGRFVPSLSDPPIAHAVCLYTNTPDKHFLIDRHPDHDDVVVAGGFSGHGFKFAPAVGDVIADLVMGHDPSVSLAPFSMRRLLS